mmetsp:Transcript_19840/g.68174  ORF Transcript_19840/g.68174 Transcript_19840/m.68174 type:complete len:219 (+) Transcript_19840:359-1015(+)
MARPPPRRLHRRRPPRRRPRGAVHDRKRPGHVALGPRLAPREGRGQHPRPAGAARARRAAHRAADARARAQGRRLGTVAPRPRGAVGDARLAGAGDGAPRGGHGRAVRRLARPRLCRPPRRRRPGHARRARAGRGAHPRQAPLHAHGAAQRQERAVGRRQALAARARGDARFAGPRRRGSGRDDEAAGRGARVLGPGQARRPRAQALRRGRGRGGEED